MLKQAQPIRCPLKRWSKSPSSEPFYAHVFEGRVHDTGTKLGFLTANVAYALERNDLRDEFRAALQTLI